MEGNGNLETIHPGKYLADKLKEQSMSRKELAIRAGLFLTMRLIVLRSLTMLRSMLMYFMLDNVFVND